MLYIIYVVSLLWSSWWLYKLMYSINNLLLININLNRINRLNNFRIRFLYGLMMIIKRGIFKRFLNIIVFKYMIYIEM